RIGAKKCKPPAVVLLPNLKLSLLLEDAHQDRRFLVHVLCFERGQHALRQWLHVAAAGHRCAAAAPGKRHLRSDRGRRQKRTQQREKKNKLYFPHPPNPKQEGRGGGFWVKPRKSQTHHKFSFIGKKNSSPPFLKWDGSRHQPFITGRF